MNLHQIKRPYWLLVMLVSIVGFGQLASSVIASEEVQALSEAIEISINDQGMSIPGRVSTHQQIYKFTAKTDDQITLDLDVKDFFTGNNYSDEDSIIWLFDEDGYLIEKNDDENEFTLESRIERFKFIKDGTYYIAVTTYGNYPTLRNNRITTWAGAGLSSIEYDLIIEMELGEVENNNQ